MKKSINVNGLCFELEEDNGVTCSNGEELTIPHPGTMREELLGDDEYNKKLEESKKATMELEKTTMLNGFKVIKSLSHINVNQITTIPSDWVVFPEYTLEEKIKLTESIKNNGLFSPIIIMESVTRDNTTNYYTISGNERLLAYKRLLKEAESTNDSKKIEMYDKIPCFILGKYEVLDIVARQIYIESNICTRTLDPGTKVKALSQMYVILKLLKEKRNDYNILENISTMFRVSKQTVINYLSVENAIEPFMYLFQQKKINLKNMKKLSKLPIEFQESILNTLGFKNINNALLNTMNITNVKTINSLKSSLEVAKKSKFPYWSTIKFKIPTKFIDDVKDDFNNLLKKHKFIPIKMILPDLSKIMFNNY